MYELRYAAGVAKRDSVADMMSRSKEAHGSFAERYASFRRQFPEAGALLTKQEIRTLRDKMYRSTIDLLRR